MTTPGALPPIIFPPTTFATAIFFGGRTGQFVRKNIPQITPDALDIVWAAADLNRDGKLDLISLEGTALGNGDGTFQPLIPFSVPPAPQLKPLGLAPAGGAPAGALIPFQSPSLSIATGVPGDNQLVPGEVNLTWNLQ